MPVRTADGTWTLRAPGHGQACHSRSGAWLEALGFFARPTRLAERARANARLRLLDVGTGLGLNLAAALAELEGSGTLLEIESLERDERVLAHAAVAGPNPEPVERWHAPVRAALIDPAARRRPGVTLAVEGVRARLRIRLGDARGSLAVLDPCEPFDAVFLDPFSRLVEPELWGEDFLRALAARMAPGAILATYSSSYTVRLNLARAGLHVGESGPVGDKLRGTLAGNGPGLAPLPDRVLERMAADGVSPE